jgi:hypothetical protein
MTNEEFLTEFFRLTDEYELYDSWYWRVIDGKVTLYANCGDVFDWGSADLEDITPENISVLEQSMKDLYETECSANVVYAASLFCARVRKLRPQGAYYKYLKPPVIALFDACGPLRPVGMGNPYPHPSEQPK